MVNSYFLLKLRYQVNTAAINDRYTQSKSVQLAVKLRDNFAHRLGSSRGRGNNVHSRRSCSTHITVDHVSDVLVVRITVNSRHKTLLDTERIVQHFYYWCKAVRRTACIRCTRNIGGKLVVVYTENDRRIDIIFRRNRKNDLFSACLDMIGITALLRFLRPENTRRFDHDLNSHICPGKFCRIPLGKDLDLLAVDDKRIALDFDGPAPFTHHGIIFKQVSQTFDRCKVVDCNQFQFAFLLQQYPCHCPSDSPKSVDCNLCCHCKAPYHNRLTFCYTYRDPY